MSGGLRIGIVFAFCIVNTIGRIGDELHMHLQWWWQLLNFVIVFYLALFLFAYWVDRHDKRLCRDVLGGKRP
jgi:membrane protein implicated in regulation of membrane protease activity